jgi:Flp pilus assembly protein TadB
MTCSLIVPPVGSKLLIVSRISTSDRILERKIYGRTLLKDFIFYSIAATVIGFIAQWTGASLGVILFAALLILPLLLLIVRIARSR